MNKILIVFYLLFFTLPVSSKAFIQVGVELNDVVSVNQRVPFTVTVLTDGYFTGAPVYRLPTINGALVMQQDSDTTSSFTTVDNVKYTSQSWTYEVYPTREGIISIPAINIEANVEGEISNLVTESYTILVKKPAVMKDIQDFLVSDQIDINQDWNGLKSSYKVGDIITRVIEIKANNTSQLVIPDFEPSISDGFSFFTSEPELNDVYHRSDHFAKIRQSITYTIKSAGTHQLGGEVISWWNPETRQKSSYQFKTISIESGFSFIQFLKSYWLVILIIITISIVVFSSVLYTIKISKKWQGYFDSNSRIWLSQLYWNPAKKSNCIVLFRQIYQDEEGVEHLMTKEYKYSKRSSLFQRAQWLLKKKIKSK